MITRPAVRFERAGFFRFQAFDYVIGDCFEDGEFFLARVYRSKIRDLRSEIRDLRSGIQRGFQLVQPVIYLLHARENGGQIAAVLLGFQQPSNSFGKLLSVIHRHGRCYAVSLAVDICLAACRRGHDVGGVEQGLGGPGVG